MVELLKESIDLINLPFTVLFGISILYWMMVIVGVLDAEMFDFDAGDFDIDADLDVDMDADVGADVDGSHSGLGEVLDFITDGDAPLMAPMTLFSGSMWMFSVMGNYYFNPNDSNLISAGILAVGGVVSIVLMKLLTKPIAGLYRMMNKDYDAPDKVVGSLATVSSMRLDERLGTVNVQAKGAPIQLNAKYFGGRTLEKGAQVLVTEFDKENNTYTVQPVETEE